MLTAARVSPEVTNLRQLDRLCRSTGATITRTWISKAGNWHVQVARDVGASRNVHTGVATDLQSAVTAAFHAMSQGVGNVAL